MGLGKQAQVSLTHTLCKHRHTGWQNVWAAIRLTCILPDVHWCTTADDVTDLQSPSYMLVAGQAGRQMQYVWQAEHKTYYVHGQSTEGECLPRHNVAGSGCLISCCACMI